MYLFAISATNKQFRSLSVHRSWVVATVAREWAKYRHLYKQLTELSSDRARANVQTSLFSLSIRNAYNTYLSSPKLGALTKSILILI